MKAISTILISSGALFAGSPASAQHGPVTEIEVCASMGEIELYIRRFADGMGGARMVGSYSLAKAFSGTVIVSDFDPVVGNGNRVVLFLRNYYTPNWRAAYNPDQMRELPNDDFLTVRESIKREMESLYPCP